MSDGRFAVIDPAAGISGDMLLGALVGAGAPVAWLEGLPARLGIPEVTVAVQRVDRCGIQAVKVRVQLPGGVEEAPAELVTHGGGGHHHHHGPAPHHHDGDHGHRHVGDLVAMVARAPLSEWVRARAIRAFELLGEAEGRVHGMPAADVPLHEVGALDALVDIVGGIEGFEQLGIDNICNRPVALGTGWVHAAHGTIPVPAPASTHKGPFRVLATSRCSASSPPRMRSSRDCALSKFSVVNSAALWLGLPLMGLLLLGLPGT